MSNMWACWRRNGRWRWDFSRGLSTWRSEYKNSKEEPFFPTDTSNLFYSSFNERFLFKGSEVVCIMDSTAPRKTNTLWASRFCYEGRVPPCLQRNIVLQRGSHHKGWLFCRFNSSCCLLDLGSGDRRRGKIVQSASEHYPGLVSLHCLIPLNV